MDQLKVHFCLATASDTVEQIGVVAAELDVIDCHRLFLGQGHCFREGRGGC